MYQMIHILDYFWKFCPIFVGTKFTFNHVIARKSYMHFIINIKLNVVLDEKVYSVKIFFTEIYEIYDL